jgi:hypothetical protein
VGGEIPKSDADPKAFAYRKWSNGHMEGLMAKVHRELSAVKPDIAIIFNYTWMAAYPVTPPWFIPHLTWDTPTPQVGNYSWNFSAEARYLNTLPEVPFSAMNTRGNNWGDYALREPEAFQHECAILLAACGGNYLSDIPYPSGNPDRAVYDVFGQVNRRYQSLEPLLKGSKPVREAAVLHSADSVWSKSPLKPHAKWNFTPAYYSVTGAHKALTELHLQMGIVNSRVCLDTLPNYRVLILSDQRILSEEEASKIREFVRNGGALLATHETGTRDARNGKLADFALANFLPRFRHYARWLLEMLGPPLAAWAIFLARRDAPSLDRALCAAWPLPCFLLYCFYGPYETWWYTRYLLPAIPALILAMLLAFQPRTDGLPNAV